MSLGRGFRSGARRALSVVAAVSSLAAVVPAVSAEDLGYDDGFAEALHAAERDEDAGAGTVDSTVRVQEVVGLVPRPDAAAVASDQPPSVSQSSAQAPGE